MTSRLRAEGLTVAFRERTVLEDVSLAIPDGQVTAIIGPNACGKTTLLRTLARLIKPAKGRVLLDGHPILDQSTRAVARKLAMLPQSAQAPAGMRVEELVLRGRTPHQSPIRQWSEADRQALQKALDCVGLSALAGRRLENLSGGQRQRAWIAMTLAQQTDIVLLDEPTTFLDVTHQIDVLKMIRAETKARGLTTAMVLHDINLAARFADHVIAMRSGHVITSGPPADVVTGETIQHVFGLNCVVITDPLHGTPHVIAA